LAYRFCSNSISSENFVCERFESLRRAFKLAGNNAAPIKKDIG